MAHAATLAASNTLRMSSHAHPPETLRVVPTAVSSDEPPVSDPVATKRKRVTWPSDDSQLNQVNIRARALPVTKSAVSAVLMWHTWAALCDFAVTSHCKDVQSILETMAWYSPTLSIWPSNGCVPSCRNGCFPANCWCVRARLGPVPVLHLWSQSVLLLTLSKAF